MSIDREPSNFWQFAKGAFFGVFAFVLLALASTFYLQSHHYCSTGRFSTGVSGCIPALEYAILKAVSWGPAAVFSLAKPAIGLSEMRVQIISGVLYAIIGGVVFVMQSRRTPMETFGILYFLLEAFTAFIVFMVVARG